jgi:hypothetical protein
MQGNPLEWRVRQLQAEMEEQASLHRAGEAVRLASAEQHVEDLHASEASVSRRMDALRAYLDQVLCEEEAHLAPFRARVAKCEQVSFRACAAFKANIERVDRLVDDAARARGLVVAARQEAVVRGTFSPSLEAAREAEQGVLVNLALSSRAGFFDMWSNWQWPILCELVRKSHTALDAEASRKDAPPLQELQRELDRVKVEHTSLLMELAEARDDLCTQKQAGSVAWDMVAVRLRESLRDAIAEWDASVSVAAFS